MSVKLAPRRTAVVTQKLEGETAMGEVRVQAKLTNVVDEGMVRRGLLPPDQVRTYTAEAVVDTGAVRSVLPVHVAQQLGLATIRKTRATYANGSQEEVELTEAVTFEINGRRAVVETLLLGDEVLIGQTVLEEMDLLVDCTNQRVIGNPAHPDQPVFKIR